MMAKGGGGRMKRKGGTFLGLILVLLFPLLGIAANVDNANPSDVAQATQFLSSLPQACGESYMDASEDGTINIHIICRGAGSTPSTNGLVRIKNGVVTQVR